MLQLTTRVFDFFTVCNKDTHYQGNTQIIGHKKGRDTALCHSLFVIE